MKILGIHYETHDAGAAIVDKNTILAAVGEERLSRVKEDGSFPHQSINEVLSLSKMEFSDLDYIAVSGEKNLLAFYWQQASYKLIPLLHTLPSIIKTGDLKFIFKTVLRNCGLIQIRQAHYKRSALNTFIKAAQKVGFKGQIKFIDHDRAHAATAYFSSGWSECLIPVFEGFSYKNASSFWIGKDNQLKQVKQVKWPNSPGQFYRCVTQQLGFSPRRHAGKITGLAAYGDPTKATNMTDELMNYKDGNLHVSSQIYLFQYQYEHTKTLSESLSQYSRNDLAAGFQTTLEKCLVTFVEEMVQKHDQELVALAGGVIGNVKLNQRIANLTTVKSIHVHPAMSDAGQATGAALGVAFSLGAIEMSNVDPIKSVYLGSDISEDDASKALDNSGLKFTKPENLPLKVAEVLQNEKVVAVCRGKMEYGPRALGNRSILYSPANSSVNDWLNKRLNRTEFMPFAPVTLKEYANECYLPEQLSKVTSATKFMTVSVDCTKYMQDTQPAVVHVDNTARPQIITREDNAFYYDTLKEFHGLTSLPSLVNTSFNMHEEPIVRSAEDAIRSFKASKIDYLVLGDYLVSQQD